LVGFELVDLASLAADAVVGVIANPGAADVAPTAMGEMDG
jgi:hypothetical protein